MVATSSTTEVLLTEAKLRPIREEAVEAVTTAAEVTAEEATPLTTNLAVEAATPAEAVTCQEVVDMEAAAATRAIGREALERARNKAQTTKSRFARTFLTGTASMATLAHSHMVMQILEAAAEATVEAWAAAWEEGPLITKNNLCPMVNKPHLSPQLQWWAEATLQ